MPPHPTPGPPAVHLQLLGDFDVRHGDRLVSIRRSGQRVLAFLGLHDRAAPRSRVAGALWPWSPAAQASANLRAALSRLPRPGDLTLTSTGQTHLALADHVEVDLHRCDARIRRLRAVGPDDVPDQDPAPAPEGDDPLLRLDRDVLPLWEDDWVLVERERFRQARLHALERLSASLRAAGRLDEALQAALASVAGEPLRESAHRRVIEVHLAEGNAAEALRQYEFYRRLLRDELGLGPSESIRRLVRSLLGRPDAAAG